METASGMFVFDIYNSLDSKSDSFTEWPQMKSLQPVGVKENLYQLMSVGKEQLL